MKKLLISVALACGTALPAKADVTSFFGINPFPISQYQTAYLTLGGGVLVRQIPKFNVPYSVVGSASPVFATDASIVTGGGGFTIGFRLDRLGIGDKPRIELAFGGWTGGATKSGGAGFDDITVPSIDGTTRFICAGPCDGATTVKIRHTELGGVLRLKTDFPVAPRWTLTPSLGFLGSYSQTRYRSDTPFGFFASDLELPAFVKETLGARRLGGEFGLDVGVKVTPRWSLEGTVALAFFSLHTDLSAHDCASFAAPAGTPCTGAAFATSTSASDTRFAIRLSMSVTATYDAGWLKLSIKGFGGWDNAMPGVRNPTSPDTNPTGTTPSIYYESRWSYGGALLATFPFFR